MKSILLTAAGGRISKKHNIIGKRDERQSRKMLAFGVI